MYTNLPRRLLKQTYIHATPLIFPKRLQDASLFLTSHVLDLRTTLTLVRDKEMSVTRFGDGEFAPILELASGSGKTNLGQELRNVLDVRDEKLLLCIPPFLPDRKFWRHYWATKWPQVEEFLPPITYGNAMISRPEVFATLGNEATSLWRDILDGRSITIVTGQGSKFRFEPALFGEPKNVRFVDSLRTDAHHDIARLRRELVGMKSDLFLFALGKTGTVLATELALSGRRSIDLGHLTNSYDTVFSGKSEPEQQ